MKESFGERIKRLRIENNLSQGQVAKTLQVSRKAISHYENNIREPSSAALIRMAGLFHVSVDYLLGLDKSLPINFSGLSKKEYALIKDLVNDMSDKNQLLRMQNYNTVISDNYGEEEI